jgi:hypothetical protein
MVMEISKETAGGIRSRIAICKLAIELIEQAVDDPRREDALAEYRGQLARLEARLAEAEKPQDIVIGLQTARLCGRA